MGKPMSTKLSATDGLFSPHDLEYQKLADCSSTTGNVAAILHELFIPDYKPPCPENCLSNGNVLEPR